MLAWPAGAFLAAGFSRGQKSLVRIYGNGGGVIGELEVPGMIDVLAWSGQSRLLFTVIEQSIFTFGGNRRTMLYNWDGSNQSTAEVLNDQTLKPATLRRWGLPLAA